MMKGIRYILLLVMALLSACNTKSLVQLPLPPQASNFGVASFDAAAGTRNFRAIFSSMSAVTTISVTDGSNTANSLNSAFLNSKPGLSPDGDPLGTSTSMMLKVSSLASLFCNATINKAKASTPNMTIFSNIDFTKGPSVALTPVIRALVISKITNAFWQRNPTPAETTAFLQAIDAAITGQAATATQATNDAALVVCTAALSSIGFLKL